MLLSLFVKWNSSADTTTKWKAEITLFVFVISLSKQLTSYQGLKRQLPRPAPGAAWDPSLPAQPISNRRAQLKKKRKEKEKNTVAHLVNF